MFHDTASHAVTQLPYSRRHLLRSGLIATTGYLLTNQLGWCACSKQPPRRAHSVIQIWLGGGPCHIDTFDPKPEAGNNYCGPLNQPIATTDRSVFISELMPLLAKQFKNYSIIRSMTHGNNGHETAAYLVQTGQQPSERIVHPGAGAVISFLKGKDNNKLGILPPYIVLTQPQGRFSEAGFLGSRYKPFATGGDPNAARFNVEGIVSQLSELQLRERRELLHRQDRLSPVLSGTPVMEALTRTEEQAYQMLLGDAGKLFDLNQEKTELRDRYGRTTFGQSCLMARRLVAQGVPYVTINLGGWDTHKDHFQTMRRKLPDLDKGLSALFEDLADRGLLTSTMVWCCGEFGRTPKVAWEAPWNGGRHHYGKVFSAIVGGGGFRGGCVVGASDARGEAVRDRPVYPQDLIGSVYQLMGIDPQSKLPHPQGVDVSVTAESKEQAKGIGILHELM